MLRQDPDYRQIVSQCAGAEYVGRRGSTILFRDVATDTILSLYVEALTPQNIYLSCKAAREQYNAIPEWQEVTTNERG